LERRSRVRPPDSREARPREAFRLAAHSISRVGRFSK
jgi:hypothetical protein